jgi:hypothetical protein
MPKPRVVIFFDANVDANIKKEFESPALEVVLLKRHLRMVSDARLFKYFQQEAANKYQGSFICILTHDQNFDSDAGYKLDPPISIIKIPQTPWRSAFGRLILNSLKSFFDMIISASRLCSFAGVIKFE